MNEQCGYWAHCALHCDMTCNHNQWCPGYPVADTKRTASWLRRIVDRLERGGA